jgi:hypothetical protein
MHLILVRLHSGTHYNDEQTGSFSLKRLKTITDFRLELLNDWLMRDLTFGAERIAPASEDASFRRYFRVWRDGETFIVMDAPPDKQELKPYLNIAGMLTAIGVHVPRILAEDHERGFLLVTDLGTRQYLDDLATGRHVESHYLDAIMALCRIQSRGQDQPRGCRHTTAQSFEREVNSCPNGSASASQARAQRRRARDLAQLRSAVPAKRWRSRRSRARLSLRNSWSVPDNRASCSRTPSAAP